MPISTTVTRYSPSVITKGIKYIKINRFDEQGTDNTISLQELTNLRLLFEDLGIVDFPILSIAEYSDYYLYRVGPVVLGNSTDKFKSPTDPNTATDTYSLTSGDNTSPIFYGYTNTTGSINGNGLYNFQNGGYTVTATCYFSASATVVSKKQFYVLFTGSNGIISKQLFNPNFGSPGTGSYSASISYVPTSGSTLGVAFASSSVNINFNLPSIDFRITQDITSSIDNNILNHNFSASAYTGSDKLYITDPGSWTGIGLSSSINPLSYFTSSTNKYTFGDTPNHLIHFTSSVYLEGSGGQIILELRKNITDVIATEGFSVGGGTTVAISASFLATENDACFLYINNDGSGFTVTASNVQWQFTQSVSPHSESNLTVLEPYLTENFFYSDCNALYGNADGLEYDDSFMKILYDDGSVIPSNQSEILSNTAERAPVKSYNYALRAQVIPRYNGVKLIQQNRNIWTEGDTSFGKEPSVQNLGTYFAYFDYMNGTDYILTNKKAAHILYLIDKDGKVQTPTLDSPYYPNLTQNFLSGENANISFETSTGNAANIQGIKPIIRSGVYPKPVIYSQTGSNANSSSNIIFDNIYELSNVPDYLTSIYLYPQTWQINTYNNFLDAYLGTDPIVNFISPNVSYNSVSPDRNLEIDVSSNKTQIIASISIPLKTVFPTPSALGAIRILKSTDGGTTWNEIAILNNFSINSSYETFSLSTSPQITTLGDKYRVTINTVGIPGFIQQGQGTFSLSQTPAPSNISINPPYWITGSLSKNILTGSAFTGSYITTSPLYQTFPSSSASYEPVLPFTLQTNDEIRFEGDETQIYTITTVETGISGSLYLTLNRNIADGTDLDSFLIRRYTPDPGYILLDIPSEGGGTGFIFPEHVTLDVQRNFNTIIQNLKEKGLIPI